MMRTATAITMSDHPEHRQSEPPRDGSERGAPVKAEACHRLTPCPGCIGDCMHPHLNVLVTNQRLGCARAGPLIVVQTDSGRMRGFNVFNHDFPASGLTRGTKAVPRTKPTTSSHIGCAPQQPARVTAPHTSHDATAYPRYHFTHTRGRRPPARPNL